MLEDFRADLQRYRALRRNGSAVTIFTYQGVWALAQYRFARWVRRSGRGLLLRAISLVWQRLIEITTGISLPGSADIGPGFYIGHFGGIIVSADAVIDAHCNISQGVTVGVAGVGDDRGVPRIGTYVYMGAGAKLIGKIRVGDYVTIGANAVVTTDIPDGAVVAGVPAKVLRIDPETAHRNVDGHV